jgi:hypothetical protein
LAASAAACSATLQQAANGRRCKREFDLSTNMQHNTQRLAGMATTY